MVIRTLCEETPSHFVFPFENICTREVDVFLLTSFCLLLICSGATTDNPGENSTSYGFNQTNSYLCPPGHYCESGDETPRPCPNGTFNDRNNASHEGQCHPCALNHFNPYSGQSACLPCSANTVANTLGSDSCECTGLNRVFKVLIAQILFFNLSFFSIKYRAVSVLFFFLSAFIL